MFSSLECRFVFCCCCALKGIVSVHLAPWTSLYFIYLFINLSYWLIQRLNIKQVIRKTLSKRALKLKQFQL